MYTMYEYDVHGTLYMYVHVVRMNIYIYIMCALALALALALLVLVHRIHSTLYTSYYLVREYNIGNRVPVFSLV